MISIGGNQFIHALILTYRIKKHLVAPALGHEKNSASDS